MNILEIIAKKRDKQELSKEEIEYFVQGYTKGEITDYQAAALVMAIYLNQMTGREITNLTLAMAYSGDVLDLSEIGQQIVDKHSTGGVGDKVSLILLPTVSSLGVKIAKMSGRGLGFTGGTVDKLESIPGYQTNLPIQTFIQNVKEIGISMIGQTLNLAPADKKLYALRDTISCTDSIPLIASSIMSKKIASGAQNIVLDVTYGSGAFMKTKEEANKLAKTMQEIGELAGKNVTCILTSMEQPLGKAVGNTLEVIETIRALNGQIEPDVEQVILLLGSHMLKMGGLGDNLEENKEKIKDAIKSGKAFQKFIQMVEKQGGDISYLLHPEKFEKAKYITPVLAEKEGKIQKLHALSIAEIACSLGAGRTRKEDKIDPAVGIVLEKKIGDKVKKQDTLGYLYANREITQQEKEKFLNSYVI